MNHVTIHLKSGKTRTIASDSFAYRDDGQTVLLYQKAGSEGESILVAVAKDFELIELGGAPDEDVSPVEYLDGIITHHPHKS